MTCAYRTIRQGEALLSPRVGKSRDAPSIQGQPTSADMHSQILDLVTKFTKRVLGNLNRRPVDQRYTPSAGCCMANSQLGLFTGAPNDFQCNA